MTKLSNSVLQGLNDKEVIKNREIYGSNKITSLKKDSFLKKLLGTLGDPIIKILLIALGIKVIFLIKSFDWYETVGIVIAIFLASFISTISEYGSERAFEKLQESASKIKCKVKRNGKIVEVVIDELVCNDVVLLQAGDKIPADGVLIDGGITVDESTLNGEAKEKYKEAPKFPGQDISDFNTVYRDTIVCSKSAYMLVTKVGDKTLYGKLAIELQDEQPESPLKLRLRALAKIISRIGYVGAILVSLSYLFSMIVIKNNFDGIAIINTLHDFPLITGYILYALTLSVTVIVVAVPEGLPMMITLVLSSNMKRMLKDNVLVRKLVGIETAGSLNVLFTDKTGTLTNGKLNVTGFIDGNLNRYSSKKNLMTYPNLYHMVKQSMIINNESSYDYDQKVSLGSNITDRALMLFMDEPFDSKINKIKTVPFDSKKKYALTIINDHNHLLKLIKGAPEIIINKCQSYYTESGNILPFKNRQLVNQKIESLAEEGIRLIAMAFKTNDSNPDNLDNLIFLGLVLIKDEVRKEAIYGVELINKAHINTVMITGDNKTTALAIAKEVGIVKNDQDIVLTSADINTMSDEALKQVLPNLRVVARSLPQDKSRLVKIAQSMGMVVGMTGDGINDAPALKKADVGFAMGSGTEIAREASDIVILDDNFLSITKAVLYGRTIFKSIRKFIILQLTANLCALSLSIIGPFIGVNTPVTVIQMLWINMVMDTLAGVAFAFEPPIIEYMDEYPKRKDENIINRYMKNEIIVTGFYSAILCIFFLKLPWFKEMFRLSVDNRYFLTAFFGLLIFIDIFNCFNARTNRLNLLAHLNENRIFILIIGLIFMIQIIMIYYGGTLFRTAGLSFREFQITIFLAMTVIPVDWIRKIWLRKNKLVGGV